MASLALLRTSIKIVAPCRNISSKSKTLLSTGGSFGHPNFLSDGMSNSVNGLRQLHLSNQLCYPVITIYAPPKTGDITQGVFHILKDVGDTVGIGTTIAEVETTKAEVPLLSPVAGTIDDILVVEGATINALQPLIKIKTP